MKKRIFQFGIALLGAAAGGAAFALLWQHIDRFFYDAFGIVLQCDGCHTASLSLLYGFIPVSAGACCAAFNKIFYREGGWPLLFCSLAACVLIGGTLSLLAVQIARGAVAAVLIACSMGISAVLGIAMCNLPVRQS
jgi:hypothetical protein